MAGTNPILDELGGLSPGAQQALLAAHNSTALTPPPTTPPVDQGLQAPSKIQKPAQIGAPPTAQPASMPSPTPNVGSYPMPNVEAPRGTLQGDINERGRLEATGPGITQIHSKIENSEFGQNHPTLGKIAGYGAEIPLRILEAAGSTLGPVRSAEQLLPGTQAHHAMEMRNLNSNIGKESEENVQGAQAGAENARAGLTNLDAANEPQKAADEHALTQSTIDKNERDPAEKVATLQQLHAQAVQRVVEQGGDPSKDPIVQNYENALIRLQPGQNKEPTGQHVNIVGPDGKPTIGTFHPDTGKTTDASGKEIPNPQPYEKPMSVHVGDAHEFAENERGRGLLDKAESSYRTAHQGAQGIRAAVDDAMQGGKMSARMLPLEGALEITTANGVHRINRTEVDQYAGGGSLYDRLAGALKGGGTGIPFTNEIMQDMKHLADLQEKGAYDNYKGAFDSATQRYGLKDEKPLPQPGGSGGGGSKGSVNLKDAMALPINKGKSEQEVRQHVESLGYTVK